MSSIGSIGGASLSAGIGDGGNPLSGMGGDAAGSQMGGTLSGIGDLGVGSQGNSGAGTGASLGLAPTQAATDVQGSSFASALKTMVIDQPSASKAYAGDLGVRFAAGDTSIDPHQLSIASAKAGVEIQMATRTISSAVSSVRTLFQMQV